MGLLKKAVSTQAKLKAGVYGGTGSGKTWTASLIAAGLHQFIKSTKPVAFFDTETGSDFVLEAIFKPAKIELLQLKSRSFTDLLTVVKEAEKESSVLIIDSITHVWEDFKKAYLKKTGQHFIELWDWGKLKETWAQFTDLYVNSDLHIVLAGREAAIYEQTEEIRGGQVKKVAQKVGAKMKSESEQGYEPSLLMQMEKVHIDDDATGKYIRRCHVVKDRFNVIDSRDFDNPTFETFLPHVKLLNLNGTQLGIDVSRTSEDAFDFSGDGEMQRRARRRAILCEEIEGVIVHYFPGTSQKEKKIKGDIIKKMFGVWGWKAVTDDWKAVTLERLEDVMKPLPDAPCLLEQECVTRLEETIPAGDAKPGKE